jgi:hypothetical protein
LDVKSLQNFENGLGIALVFKVIQTKQGFSIADL